MKIPEIYPTLEEHIRQAAQAINLMDDGNFACNGIITLTENVVSTVVKNYKVGKDSVVLFMPLTANAATELYGATMYVSDISPRDNEFTITHANNAQTDRQFRYVVLGQTLN